MDDRVLFPVIAELRVIKTEMELQALRYISKVSSDAHKVVMRKIKPGMKVRGWVHIGHWDTTVLHNWVGLTLI